MRQADERTFGVEEELLLIDPSTHRAVPRAAQVLAGLATDDAADAAVRAGRPPVEHELFRHQLEIQSDPCHDATELRRQLAQARGAAADAAHHSDLVVAAAGTCPTSSEVDEVTDDDRYRAMVDTFGDVARGGGTCGMHVHVAVASPGAGVQVIDAIAPWLPVLLAVSTNSPFADGHDTGYASWRSRQWARWPSAGPTEIFGSPAGYRAATAALIASGAARDEGMIYFDARLSRTFPTVEVRVCDVATDLDDAVLIAVLTRALVAAAADEDPHRHRVELVRAAHWRAARDGLGDRLLDPVSMRPERAADVLGRLVDHVRPSLSSSERDLVDAGAARVLAGTGSVRQRAAFERSGSLDAVVADLVDRTRRTREHPSRSQG